MNTNIKKNYDLLMNEQIKKIKELNIKPKLLLHTCCAPCSSMVIETFLVALWLLKL